MEPNENIQADVEMLRTAVRLILTPNWERGDVVELRALGTKKGVCSGYFDADHQEELVAYAAHLSGCAHGIYITLNPVMPDCLAGRPTGPSLTQSTRPVTEKSPVAIGC